MSEKVTAPPTKKARFHPLFPDAGRPTWEIAYLFPPQGRWTEGDYLNLAALTLAGTSYQVHGQFGAGTRATSLLLPEFHVDVDAVMAHATKDVIH